MSMKELSPNKKLLIVFGVFLAAYFIPWGATRILGATNEAFLMLGEYARQHVLLCLVPAMFIAGAITVFLNQQAVMRYLGPPTAWALYPARSWPSVPARYFPFSRASTRKARDSARR
jgi:hypothetical protein